MDDGCLEILVRQTNQLPTYDNLSRLYGELALPSLLHSLDSRGVECARSQEGALPSTKKECMVLMIINLMRIRPTVFLP